MPRIKRTEPRSGTRVTLQRRDQALITSLNRFRLATTHQLATVVFRGIRSDTAGKRLRLLLDARYVEVRTAHASAPNLYSIGPEGRRWLRGQGTEPGRIPRGNLDHHLAIVSTWIDLAQAVAQLPGWKLERFIPSWELRQRPERGGVIPDAFLRLRLPALGGPPRLATLALELDRGSESTRQLQYKLQRYVLTGDLDVVLAVALVGATPRRRVAIQHLLTSAWPGSALLWNDRAELHAELERLAGLPLPAPCTDPPDGKGSAVLGTCSLATTSREEHPGSSAT